MVPRETVDFNDGRASTECEIGEWITAVCLIVVSNAFLPEKKVECEFSIESNRSGDHLAQVCTVILLDLLFGQ